MKPSKQAEQPERPKTPRKSARADKAPKAESTGKAAPDDAESAAQPPKKKRSRRSRPRQSAEAEPAVAESTPSAAKKPAAKKPATEEVAAKKPADEKVVAEKPAGAPPKRRRKRSAAEAEGFAAMGLSDIMLDSLDAAGYLDPTPIQQGLIPRALAEVDLMGQAQTGTGKTAAFAIPLLEQLNPHAPGQPPQALVLVPTRELAVQVRDEFSKLAAGREVNVVGVYGGKPIRQQTERLRRGAEVVVGTPGRVIDLITRGALLLGQLRFVVLDEADRMLDIGFRPDIEKILRRCPASRQTLLLSATIPPPVKRLAERYMRNPEMVDFSVKDLSVETIEQFYFTVDPERKFDLLVSLLRREEPRQAIVFCRTKRGTDRTARRLSRIFEHADTIHGDLAQSARDRVMQKFRAGKIQLLVATDVVGRGIDVSGISHIINFDIPQFCDDYVHRVGRTGRMGREGVAYTFVTPEEGNELTRIEMRINRLLKRDEIDGFDALSKPEADEDLDLEADVARYEPPEPKPVFGKRTRRYRRAL